LVEADIVKAAEDVKSCTISDAELTIKQLHIISEAEPRLPFSLEDASRPESELEKEDAQFSRVALDTRLNHRVLDLRVRHFIVKYLRLSKTYLTFFIVPLDHYWKCHFQDPIWCLPPLP
jgi:aspartyl/asparaginyl-tRNA synthetase